MSTPMDQLDAAAKQAQNISVTFRTAETPNRLVEMEFQPRRAHGYVGAITASGASRRQNNFNVPHTRGLFDRVFAALRGVSIRLETVRVTTTQSAQSAKVLTPVAVAAVAVASGASVPDDAALHELRRAFRTELQTERANRAQAKEQAKERASRDKQRRIVRDRQAHTPTTAVTDVPSFLAALKVRIQDAPRISKSMKMLKKAGFQLYHDASPDEVVGVVKSQTDRSLVYACRLASDGTYSCCTQNLNPCGGLRGKACKHILLLLIGLVQSGELDPVTVDGWLDSHLGHKPLLDRNYMGDVFLKYKGAEAGEVDWRPTETTPEDFYAY